MLVALGRRITQAYWHIHILQNRDILPQRHTCKPQNGFSQSMCSIVSSDTSTTAWLGAKRDFEVCTLDSVISPDFYLEFSPGKHLIHFLVLKMKDFRKFVLDNCILDFDAEQVYLKLQATNLKNKEVTVNPKPQTLEKSFRKS